jgi:hypothetical protein
VRRENEPDYELVAREREPDIEEVKNERERLHLLPPPTKKCTAIVVQTRLGKVFMAVCGRINCKGHGPGKRQEVRL